MNLPHHRYIETKSCALYYLFHLEINALFANVALTKFLTNARQCLIWFNAIKLTAVNRPWLSLTAQTAVIVNLDGDARCNFKTLSFTS